MAAEPDEISAETNVDDLVAHFPMAARVFIRRRMGCVGCEIAPFESLADVARTYRQPLNDFLDEIRSTIKCQKRSELMSQDVLHRSRPVGQTTGTDQRAAQQVIGPALTFHLDQELEQLRGEDAFQQNMYSAKTLIKEADLRIVLIAMRKGARILKHQAPGQVAIQALRGEIRVGVASQRVALPAGSLLTIEGGIAHDVEAFEDSAFLLTIAWAKVSDRSES